MPRARKSNCDLRKSIVRETASITNADRVSPGASTLSASARSSSETRSGGMVRDLVLDMNSSSASQLRYILSSSGVLRKFRECGFAAQYRRNRRHCARGRGDSRVGGPMRANEKWSGRWESNPYGRLLKAYKIRHFVNRRRLSNVEIGWPNSPGRDVRARPRPKCAHSQRARVRCDIGLASWRWAVRRGSASATRGSACRPATLRCDLRSRGGRASSPDKDPR